jgi:hypothetical protein
MAVALVCFLEQHDIMTMIMLNDGRTLLDDYENRLVELRRFL